MGFSKILVANTGEDSLLLIDLKNYTVIRKIELSKHLGGARNLRPYDMELCDKGLLYLVNSYDDSLMKLDLENNILIDWMKVGRCPSCIKIFNGKIYVVNSDSNSISIIDEKSFTLIEDISLREKPVDMVIDRMTERIFIASVSSYCINILDLRNGNMSHMSLNQQPVKIIIEDKVLFILSYLDNGLINYSNLLALELEGKNTRINMGLKGIFSDLIKISGQQIFYMLNADEGYLYRLSIDGGMTISRTYLGGMPSNILWDGRDRLYISNSIKNSIIVMDQSNQEIICKIRVGKEPNKILLL